MNYVDSMSAGHVEQSLLRGGPQHSIQEVEEALYLHPAVRECVVMEVPDQIHSEEIIAFVTLRAELTGREQELRDWLGYTVPDCKIAKRIVILSEIPKKPQGIVDRSALKDLVRSFETGLDIVNS